VMSLAGAAEIIVTGTIRDLVVGSGIHFEEIGVHELKGVEGTWLVYRTVYVDGHPIEQPMSSGAARTTIDALGLGRGRPRRLGLIATISVLVAGLAVAIALVTLSGGAAANRYGTNSLIRVDQRTGRVLEVVPDRLAVPDSPTHVFAYRGTLWDWDNNYGFIHWDLQTGQLLAAFGDRKVAGCPYEPGWDIAFGTIWLWCSSDLNGTPPWWLVRLDELSYRHLATIRLPHFFAVASSGWGLGAYWVIDRVGHLVRVDAATSRIADTYSTPILSLSSCSNPSWYPGVVGPVIVGGVLWFAQCDPNELIGFDPATRRASTFAIPQEVGWLMTVRTAPDTLWLFDPYGGTLTPFDTSTKTVGEPIALPGTPESPAVTNDAIWVAAGTVVDRVGIFGDTYHVITTIPMPKGVWASSIAADPSTGIVWVTNNTYAKSHPEWAGEGGP
jgi:hypothetical protein